MSKNIVVLSDGTGNSAAKANKTNVWRLYASLDKSKPDEQVVFYDDGVGTEPGLVNRTLGGAVGKGLRRNVMELYDFVSRSYEDGDKIYFFGFSRGGFTVRFLAGMIAEVGLLRLSPTTAQHEWEAAAKNAYFKYLETFGMRPIQRLRPYKTQPMGFVVRPEIAFLGVWDSVDAYGFPADFVAQAWDKLVFPIYFPNLRLNQFVKKARQALAIDDERETFHPLLWDESTETPGSDRIEQVWFTGVHADVGGGYFRSGLAHVSLLWMIDNVALREDRDEGLIFVPEDVARMRAEANAYGQVHNSRLGMKAFYRYSPRILAALSDIDGTEREKVEIETPKIHRSVFERIRDPLSPYAPIGLPERYEVWPPSTALEGEDAAAEFETEEARRGRAIASKALLDVVASRRKVYWLFTLYAPLVILVGVFLADFGVTAETGPVTCEQDCPGVSVLEVAPFSYVWSYLLAYVAYWPVTLGLALLGFLLLRKRKRIATRTDELKNDMWRDLKASATRGGRP